MTHVLCSAVNLVDVVFVNSSYLSLYIMLLLEWRIWELILLDLELVFHMKLWPRGNDLTMTMTNKVAFVISNSNDVHKFNMTYFKTYLPT